MTAASGRPGRRAWWLAGAAYLALYAAVLAAMHLREGFGLAEPLFVLAVYGAAFTALAWWSTRHVAARELPLRNAASEARLLLVCFLFLAAFVTFAFPVVRGLSPNEAVQTIAIVGAKLAAFVLLPYLLLRAGFGYRMRDFVDWRAGLRGHWRPLIAVAIALVAFQLVFGRAPRDLAALAASPGELGIGIALALAVATVEAGICEEFFFRVLLLERLAAWLRSPGPALVLSSLLFGLAHAPGLYLRPQLTLESLAEPSLLLAVGYSVVVLSVAGFLFGVLWLRTRNLLLVALLHGINDCVPAIAETVGWLRAAG